MMANCAFADELEASAIDPESKAARTLILPTSAGEAVGITTDVMAEHFGLQTIDVYDLEFKRLKTFEGISLRALLDYAEIELGEQLVFVAIDGYQIAFDSSLLLQADLDAIVAFRDLDATAGLNWQLFQHGRHLVNFDPFYLVWRIANEDLDDPDIERLSTLPWPYQMNEIRIVDKNQYLAATPSEAMGRQVQTGFDLYVKNCIKCHQIKGVGGVLAAAIDRENTMTLLIDDSLLRDIIWKIKDYIPETKMPDYRDSLSRAEVEAIVTYIQTIQTPLP